MNNKHGHSLFTDLMDVYKLRRL